MKLDWPKTKLKKHTVKIGSGITPKGGEAVYKSSGIPLIRSQNVLVNRLDLSDVAYIEESQHKKMSGSKVYSGDVLLNITGASIGRSCVVPKEIGEANVNQHVCIIRLKETLDARLLSTYLNSWFGQKQIWSFQSGGSREGINFQQIGSFDIPLPPLPEQKAIADILSTWDEAIEKTEKLIKEKEKRFKQMSKWFLFGHKRVSLKCSGLKKGAFFSFSKDWELLKIGKVAKEVSVRNNNSNAIVLSCSKYDGLVNSLDYFGKKVFSDDTSNYKVVKKWQFAYPSNHVEEGSIGLLEHCDEGIVSPIYVVFETNQEQVYPPFLYKLLKTEIFRHIFQVSTSSSVDRRGSLRWNEFSTIKIPVPSIEEQKQIAETLNSAQDEINLLKKLSEKYKQQKQGLMQKLLTGEWRVRNV
ncbi:MAG TPA: restriction endonuclease subunit S [bacterium]|nr:restriction endonuclease subunit S [bacterium]